MYVKFRKWEIYFNYSHNSVTILYYAVSVKSLKPKRAKDVM